jgi:hypothetical protein
MAKKEFKKEAPAAELEAAKASRLMVVKKEKEMTLDEAKAYRASQHKPQKAVLSEAARRQQFKLFWTQNRKKFGKSKDLEPILWIHLKATGNDQAEKFEDGMAHFGLKRIR